MAEKDHQLQQVYPLAPANGHARSDEEAAASAQSKELKRNKRKKCFIYIAIFAVFQAAIILVFALTVMKIRTPKFRVWSATFETFDVQTANSSFNIRMNAELGVRNTNFGHYKYEDSPINFFYRGNQIGSAFVLKGRARARSTKKINIVVDLISSNLQSNPELGSDLNSGGFLPLSSQSRLNGKIHFFKVIKKKKSTELSCTMEIDFSTRELRNLNCK